MRALDILAVAAVAYGAIRVLSYTARKGERRAQRTALQTWEAEGGAVPTSRSRTAVQVTPTPTAASY
jgi:hypothetical protein